jgi:hypothetical protein
MNAHEVAGGGAAGRQGPRAPAQHEGENPPPPPQHPKPSAPYAKGSRLTAQYPGVSQAAVVGIQELGPQSRLPAGQPASGRLQSAAAAPGARRALLCFPLPACTRRGAAVGLRRGVGAQAWKLRRASPSSNASPSAIRPRSQRPTTTSPPPLAAARRPPRVTPTCIGHDKRAAAAAGAGAAGRWSPGCTTFSPRSRVGRPDAPYRPSAVPP